MRKEHSSFDPTTHLFHIMMRETAMLLEGEIGIEKSMIEEGKEMEQRKMKYLYDTFANASKARAMIG